MKSSEIKNLISEKYNISKKDIKVRQDHGWIHIFIGGDLKNKFGFKNSREQREFECEVERLVIGSTDVYTYLTDDNRDENCILIDTEIFKY